MENLYELLDYSVVPKKQIETMEELQEEISKRKKKLSRLRNGASQISRFVNLEAKLSLEMYEQSYEELFQRTQAELRAYLRFYKTGIFEDELEKIAKEKKVTVIYIKNEFNLTILEDAEKEKLVELASKEPVILLSDIEELKVPICFERIRGLKRELDMLHKEDFYEFLEYYSGQRISLRNKDAGELMEISNNLLRLFNSDNSEKAAAERIIAACKTVFENNETKADYDYFLRYSKIQNSLIMVRKLVVQDILEKKRGETIINSINAVLGNKSQALRLLRGYCKNNDIVWLEHIELKPTAIKEKIVNKKPVHADVSDETEEMQMQVDAGVKHQATQMAQDAQMEQMTQMGTTSASQGYSAHNQYSANQNSTDGNGQKDVRMSWPDEENQQSYEGIQPKKKSKVKYVIVILIIILIALIAAVIFVVPYALYNKAMTHVKSGNIDAANNIFEKIIFYKDSAEMLDGKSDYLYAKQVYEDGYIEDAIWYLEEYGTEYEPSVELMDKILQEQAGNFYELAEQARAVGEYEEAIEYYLDASNYLEEDVDEEIFEAYCAMADEETDYEKKVQCYKDANEYGDTNQLIAEVFYEQANRFVSNENYMNAILCLEQAQTYGADVSEEILGCKYAYVVSNPDLSDSTVSAYMEELVNANYGDINNLYDELTRWKLTDVCVNDSDSAVSGMSQISTSAGQIVVHYKLSGGKSGETYRLRFVAEAVGTDGTRITWNDGYRTHNAESSGTWSTQGYLTGDMSSYYQGNYNFVCYIYNDNTNELLTSVSATLVP